FQNSGGCSPTSQRFFLSRGEKYRSFERLPSSSARAPTMTPVYGSLSGSTSYLPESRLSRFRVQAPFKVLVRASRLSRPQQSNRETFLGSPSGRCCVSGKVFLAFRASTFCPTIIWSLYSLASLSR